MTSLEAILGMIRAAVGTGFQREISAHNAERVITSEEKGQDELWRIYTSKTSTAGYRCRGVE
jgi:hypothetical protein